MHRPRSFLPNRLLTLPCTCAADSCALQHRRPGQGCGSDRVRAGANEGDTARHDRSGSHLLRPLASVSRATEPRGRRRRCLRCLAQPVQLLLCRGCMHAEAGRLPKCVSTGVRRLTSRSSAATDAAWAARAAPAAQQFGPRPRPLHVPFAAAPRLLLCNKSCVCPPAYWCFETRRLLARRHLLEQCWLA